MANRLLKFMTDPDVEWFDAESLDGERPKTRADCKYGERPCPWIACTHHVLLELGQSGKTLVIPRNGWDKDRRSIGVRTPKAIVRKWLEDASDLVTTMVETCTLDVEEGEVRTLDDIGQVFNLTRERIRQVEGLAYARFKSNARAMGITFEQGPGSTL